mmetsp:Transcript_31897/g.84965  ORF Transcript_31897/g.84965 Transcript_31897/m.84965 type:complete len:104 (+) Transcript_31897:74-385(+)
MQHVLLAYKSSNWLYNLQFARRDFPLDMFRGSLREASLHMLHRKRAGSASTNGTGAGVDATRSRDSLRSMSYESHHNLEMGLTAPCNSTYIASRRSAAATRVS